ncbi:hypothetical protein [Amphritea sp. HPY]
MNNDTIRSKYTARQYFKKLIGEGYAADHASSLVNAVFGGEA